MTVTELFQLYAPLAGLLALAFWTGMLSQKVADLKEDVKSLMNESGGKDGTGSRLVALEGAMDGVKKSLESIDRGMSGVQRQLATLATKGAFVPMMGDNG
jgi:hypothetical protein